jgi:tetratricopeptide (TPR) repeat protein
MRTTDTTTEGFDLDAANILAATSAAAAETASGEAVADVIYELGGGVTIVPSSTTPVADTGLDPTSSSSQEDSPPSSLKQDQEDPLAKSEELKQKGNECFKQGNYLDAIDYYTDAIEACPGIKGDEILMLQQQHEEKEREKANQRYRRDTDRRMTKRSSVLDKDDKVGQKEHHDDDNHDNDDDDDDLAPEEFQPPVHPHGKHLAIYYSNKAASLMHLEEYSEAMKCCNIAILLDSTYSKAYIRRMSCYEQTQEMDLALKDAQKALELNPTNGEIKKHVCRLEKLEAERMEKLKTETMEKLKELGNSILGNFGMSLDNFKAEKDPTTGSYSIKMV